MKKISDAVADFLQEKDIRHVFGIIGAGNAHIFDSIYKKGFTEIICVHHEQAACMAVQTYYRTSGKICAALLTTGAGSTNGVTGVVSAWADSIPCLIISGNEHSKYLELHQDLRMWGVQGYDSAHMVSKVTKYNSRVTDPECILEELHKAYLLALSGRPGPCWIDVPMNIQSTMIDEANIKPGRQVSSDYQESFENLDAFSQMLAELKNAKRPVLWLGHGIRLAGAEQMLQKLFEQLKIPFLVTWAGIDMIDSDHELNFGRAGTYGQRCANFVVQNADFVLCIGTRMAISQIGYEITELARSAKFAIVDIDQHEINKYSERYDYTFCMDAGRFIEEMIMATKVSKYDYSDWISICNEYKTAFPWVNDRDHPDTNGFINAYRFMERLNHHFKEDQLVVTDMGTALLCGHQVLKLKSGQRLMTSTGLGEMGYGLPAAIGASVARDRGEVICLNCDGGMMMNLQELQTIVHYQLPIKLFIFNNDGYLMIKHTQNALFQGRRSGVDKKSGVSCPDYSALALAFKIPSYQIRTWEDADRVLPLVQQAPGAVICEVFMDPQQPFVPKLSVALNADGTLVSPPLEDLSPLLPLETLKQQMLSGIHIKSESLSR